MKLLLACAALLLTVSCTVGLKYRRPDVPTTLSYRGPDISATFTDEKVSLGDQTCAQVFREPE